MSNLYLTDSAGRSLRHVGWNQVHTLFPTVTDEGRQLLVEGRQSGDGHRLPANHPPGTRPLPPIRPSEVDYRKDTGTLIIQNVYQGADCVESREALSSTCAGGPGIGVRRQSATFPIRRDAVAVPIRPCHGKTSSHGGD